MASIFSIAPEVLHEITSWLLVPDQAALARTCKCLHDQLTPVVWNEVELHHRGVHEGLIMWQLLDDCSLDQAWADRKVSEEYPFGDCAYRPSSRKYAQPERGRKAWLAYGTEVGARKRDSRRRELRATDNCNRQTYQYGRGQLFLGLKGGGGLTCPPSRWAGLAAHVQSLCMSVAVDRDVSAVLADLVNLRSLQLVGLPLAEEWERSSSGRGAAETSSEGNTTPPSLRFSALRRLRLRGYFPAGLVREMLAENASGLTHLDLGLLAGPRDDKANATLSPEDDDQDDESEEEQDDGSGEERQDDSEEEHGDYEQEPWALHSPYWLQGDHLPAPLSSLTHLHLVKPYTGATLMSMFGNFRRTPDRYDAALYAEWGALLDSAAGTLREAVFEHRVALEVGDTVGDGDPHPLAKGHRFITGPDLADVYFCETVLRRLLVGGRARFPRLQRLALRGIRIRAIKTLPEEVGGEAVPGVGDVPGNEERLRAAFPGCEVELFEPAYPVYVYTGYIFQNWPDNRHEAGQDAGDGLLYDESFYNDYRRRFGPDWRVGG